MGVTARQARMLDHSAVVMEKVEVLLVLMVCICSILCLLVIFTIIIIAQLCMRRRKLVEIENDPYHQQICPQQSHYGQDHHYFNRKCHWPHPCLYPSMPNLEPRISAEKSVDQRQQIEGNWSRLKQRSDRQSHLVSRSVENSEPVYQEIMEVENVDDNDHGNKKNDKYEEAVNENQKTTKVQYGKITAKESAKYRACTQDIIVRRLDTYR